MLRTTDYDGRIHFPRVGVFFDGGWSLALLTTDKVVITYFPLAIWLMGNLVFPAWENMDTLSSHPHKAVGDTKLSRG
jgi:hypothetical protein